MSFNPIAHGERAARTVLAQDRLRVLPGGGGLDGQLRHVRNLRPQHPTTVVDLSLPLQDVQDALLLIELAGQASKMMRPVAVRVAERIAAQMHPSLLPAWLSADDAPAHGYPRPGGAS